VERKSSTGSESGERDGKREREKKRKKAKREQGSLCLSSLSLSSLSRRLARARRSLGLRGSGSLQTTQRRDAPWSLGFDRCRRERGGWEEEE